MLAPRRTRPSPPGGIQEAHLPAPIGGLNALNAGTAMPPSDCIQLYNMIADEYGLRARLGYREWCTGLTGAGDNYVRSILPFTGSADNGANNKIFATTSTGIWDVTSSSASPSQLLAFGSTAGRAGHGVCCVQVTAGGHFLFYWDEVNGLHIYADASASGGPAAGTWVAASNTDITGVDPANLVFGTVFKGRVFHVERDTAKLWYTDAGAIYGAANALDLGFKLKAGGSLVGCWSWTYDGGSGLDDSLVVASRGGDICVYQGTDPSSVNSFGMSGVWGVGALPAGRDLATDFGGDLLLLTRSGIVAMSKLILGRTVVSDQYETNKIGPLFKAAMLSKATIPGWTLRLHPEEGALIVQVPEAEGTAGTQLAMALNAKSWSRLRDLPMYSSGTHEGKFYFGTVDGKVCINDGYKDAITLADPTAWTAVQYAGLTSFQNLGSIRQKQMQFIRGTFMGEDSAPSYKLAARFDFDFTELDPVTPTPGVGSTWDSGVWDTAVWGGQYSPSSQTQGSVGTGVSMAIAWRGAASGRTILVGFDVAYTQGSIL